MIDEDAWHYAVQVKGYDPKFVFCHPEILLNKPMTSLYYRGLCALSLKAAKDYFGAVESIEKGHRARLDPGKALKMARTYNTFICSIIKNSASWTLENGHRTIVATLGITLDGVMRNKVGDIAERRIRTLVMDWVIDHSLLTDPVLTKEQIQEELPQRCKLTRDVVMEFSSEPDIAFWRQAAKARELLAVVEIKGGIDRAGALERYGAATKSFQQALATSSRCKNFFLSAVYTPELERRIRQDRLVEKYFHIVQILDDASVREQFLEELFHFALRIA
jgi:hypothetical protein